MRSLRPDSPLTLLALYFHCRYQTLHFLRALNKFNLPGRSLVLLLGVLLLVADEHFLEVSHLLSTSGLPLAIDHELGDFVDGAPVVPPGVLDLCETLMV